MCIYHSISACFLDIAPLLGCLYMLLLHNVLMMSKANDVTGKCYLFMQNLAPASLEVILNNVYFKKLHRIFIAI